MSKLLKSPIIFLGFGRSGTTIISEIIFQHPDLAWISNYQSKFPLSKSINLLRNLFDNPFWKFRGQKRQLNSVPMFNKYLFFPSEPYQIWNRLTGKDFGREFLLDTTAEEDKKEEIRTFFTSIVKFQNRKRLAFKITGPSRLEYLHSIFPDAKFVWIQRNPLPNIRSLLKVDFYQDRKNNLWWKGTGVYSEKEIQASIKWSDTPSFIAALQYFKIHDIFKREQKKLGLKENVYIISYEDFVSEPVKEIKSLLKFLELKNNDEVLNYLDSLNIYNRNKKVEFYFSKQLDNYIKDIAIHGLNNLKNV